MSINLFNTQGKITKNEAKPYIWKVSNGYKISRKGKKLLGIPEDSSGKIGLGTVGDNLIILHSNIEYNGTISKSNLIMNKSLVDQLSDISDKFEILPDSKKYNELTYFILNPITSGEPKTTDNVEINSEEDDSEIREEVMVEESDDRL